MSIKKILVGIDFSGEADTALGHAFNVSRQTGAEVVLAHACSTPDLSQVSSMSAQSVLGNLREGIHARSHKRLQELCDEWGVPGVRISHVVIDEYPDFGLPAEAERQDADLVIVGTHGRTGFKRVMLGSVAERVVRYCRAPVMVARVKTFGNGGYRRILVPTDFSPAAEVALETAIGLSTEDGSIELIHCWQLPPGSQGIWLPAAISERAAAGLREGLIDAAHESGQTLLARFRARHPDVKLSFEQIEDSPARGISRRLESATYDLVVMGSRGRRGLKRWLLGSVAEVTVRHAPCSVVVAHAPDEAEAE